jgi:predicted O-linked N-acetylglucosamine transferase (SPINDLY family)
MPRKIKQYKNPFLSAKVPLVVPVASAFPNFQDAISLHQQGQLGQAEAIYRQLLEIDPANADALHLLGVIAHQTSNHKSAVDMISHAIRINPQVSIYYSNLGNALQELKQFDAAVASFNKAIALKPDFAQAYYNLGNSLQELKQFDVALVSYDKAIELKPDYSEAYSNRGNTLQELKQFDAAVANFNKAIALKPDFAQAYSNRGIALQELKQFDAAVDSFDKAIALKPDYSEAYSNRGNVMLELKQFDAAVASFDKAIALKPDYSEAYLNIGNALLELKQFDAAVASFDKAIALKPDFAQAYSNRGNTLQELKQFDAAVASFNKAIALKPDFAQAYYNLGNSLQELKQFDVALVSYDKAIELKPDYSEAYSNRGNTLQELKQFDAAVANFNKAIALKPDFAQAYYNLGNSLQELKQFDAALVSYDKAIELKPDTDYLLGIRLHIKMHLCDWQNFERNVSELSLKIQSHFKASSCLPVLALPIGLTEQRQAAETWSTDKYPYNPSLGLILKSVSKSKIRIGYFSADFHTHPVSFLSVGLFEHHDKSKFELIAFSFGPETKDEIRSRIKNAFDKFIDVRKKSDKEVAALSRELGVDIAIDLGGHTQNCRTGIFSFRAAPIQLSYLGYLGTMGAGYYDYLIAERTIIPVNSQKYFNEKIVYLPTYQVNDSKQEIPRAALSRQELNLPDSSFVFCCFNANYKITPSTFDGWMRILKAVPDSVLLLYTDIKTAAENLKVEAKKREIDPERLIFGEKIIRSQYLARCRSADLFLDTLPYNAGATASDALWAGLPVLTCMGESFASRYAASLLFAIGVPELVTLTQAEYEALAIELATNPTKLKLIKGKLENNRLTTPLFDTALFTKHIEAAYTKMYERYQADLSPDHIYITNLDSEDKT